MKIKKIIFGSLKLQITLASVLLVATAVAGVVFYMQLEMEKINSAAQYKNARSLLQAVNVSVENQYQSILFYKKTMLETRKNKLKSVVCLAHQTLQGFYDLASSGKLSEKEAKERALDELRRFRYQNGEGFIWINDTGQPYPKMVMHPTIPSLDGKILDSPQFNCAKGHNENIFKAAVEAVIVKGEDFIDYLWPKPTSDGFLENRPQISFVKLFAPWNLVIGSCLYIDDLEMHVNKRINAVLAELNKTFGRIKIGDSGYIFIFTGKRQIIYHPLYSGQKVAKLVNPATGNPILDDLMTAAKQPDRKIEYIWDKPQHKGEFRFKKMAFVTWFKPLDWYIGSSFYVDELEKPAKELRVKAFAFSLMFLVCAIAMALYLAHGIIRPLKRIIDVFAAGAQGDYSARLEVDRKDEFGELGNYFNNFMAEIDNAHNQLSQSEKRFKTLFQKSAEPRLIIEDNRFTDCNEATVKMLHAASKADVLNKQPAELSPEFQPDGSRSTEKAEEMIRQANEQGNLRFTWTHIRHDGELFPAAVELTSIPYQGKKILHVLWRDMTRQKKIEQQLIQAQKMETVGTLAGGLAHDFNNVLGGITGIVSLLEFELDQGGIDEQTLRHYLTIMEQSGQRAAAMVQQLLSLSRKQETFFVPVDLNQSLRHVKKIAENSFEKSVLLDFNSWQEEAMIMADPGQIEQVLLNCCVNGAHAMTIMRPEGERWGGTLRVTIELITAEGKFCEIYPEAKKEKYWRLAVTDTGVGMSDATRKLIFDPFFTTKDKNEGTGLGLAMVYNIVKAHNGFVDVQSAPGQGTTINLYFSAAKGKKSKGNNCRARQLDMSGEGLILVIDDECVMREMATDVLQKLGYKVIIAEDGIQGIALFREHYRKIKAIILDMAMPGMSGRETFIEMKKIDPNLKVILVSGFLKDSRVQEILDLGVRGFVQKPYSVSRFMEEVRKVVDES